MYHYSSPVSHLLVGPSGAWGTGPLSSKGKGGVQKELLEVKRRRIYAILYAHLWAGKHWPSGKLDAENEVIALKKFFAKKMEGLTISVPEG